MKMPEPIGCGYVVKWERGDTPSTHKSGYAQVLGVNVYDKQALIDLLEAAAVECENNYKLFKTYTGTLRSHDQEMASTIRKLKEKL
jgi:hypothetical protein